jgi:hypothetical protein
VPNYFLKIWSTLKQGVLIFVVLSTLKESSKRPLEERNESAPTLRNTDLYDDKGQNIKIRAFMKVHQYYKV